MDIEIMTFERQFKRGAAAAREGASRDAHDMNPGSHGIETWHAGYDHVMKLRQQRAGQASRAEP